MEASHMKVSNDNNNKGYITSMGNHSTFPKLNTVHQNAVPVTDNVKAITAAFTKVYQMLLYQQMQNLY